MCGGARTRLWPASRENRSKRFVPLFGTGWKNPGKIDLELIEVQTGSYLGEDLIERVEDDYHRSEARSASVHTRSSFNATRCMHTAVRQRGLF